MIIKRNLTLITFFVSTQLVFGQIGNLSRINMLTYGGLPVVESSFSQPKVLINESYITAYDEKLRNPVWVAFRLGNYQDTAKIQKWDKIQKWERPDFFVADERTDSKVTHEAYDKSGYDRGHMAPNATMLYQYGQLAQLETFLMSNITPQKPNLNQKIWADLEKIERDVISQDDTKDKEVTDVYVITGPIFGSNPARIKQDVAVPVSFFRIIAFRKGYFGTLKAVSFIIPQDVADRDLTRYLTTVDEIERLTHINFFPKLTDKVQHNLESKVRNLQLEDL